MCKPASQDQTEVRQPEILCSLEKLLIGNNVRAECDFLVQYSTLWSKLPLSGQKLFWAPFLEKLKTEKLKPGDETILNLQQTAAFIGLDPSRNSKALRLEIKSLAKKINDEILAIAEEKRIAKYPRNPHPAPPWELVKIKKDKIVIKWVDCSMFQKFFDNKGKLIKNYVTVDLAKIYRLKHKKAMAHFFLIASGRKKNENGYEYDCSTDDLFAIAGLPQYKYYNNFPKKLQGYYIYDDKGDKIAHAKPKDVYLEWEKARNERNADRSAIAKMNVACKYRKSPDKMQVDMEMIKPHFERWNYEQAVLRPALIDCIDTGLLHIIEQEDVFHPKAPKHKSKDIIRKKHQNRTMNKDKLNYYRLLEDGKHYNFLMDE